MQYGNVKYGNASTDVMTTCCAYTEKVKLESLDHRRLLSRPSFVVSKWRGSLVRCLKYNGQLSSFFPLVSSDFASLEKLGQFSHSVKRRYAAMP
jgi:hypothetical protein